MLYNLSQLTKVYEKRTVLDIPTLEIEKGGIYALLGPNGAGKTTLLNILGFLEPPTSGSLQYCSMPVRYSESDLQPFRKEVVVVDQHPILFNTTVYKNLEFGLKIRGIQKSKCQRIIEEALELVGMQQFIQAPAHRLSGGETQRVALARALAVSPKVFLCDEPTASVDIEHQHAIIRILKHINQIKKITVLFTTHDRYTSIRPHPKLTRSIGSSAHTIITCPEGTTDYNRELGHMRTGYSSDHLSAILRDTSSFILFSDHKTGDVLEKKQGNFALGAKLNKVRAFLSGLRKQNAVVCDNTDRVAVQMRKPADQRTAV